MKIFLIGFMGAGKTSIGKRLAKSLNYKFIDMDKLIEFNAGQSINELFKEHGEKHFRELEKTTLEELKPDTNIVIATGGGTPCYEQNMEFMNETGTTIYLNLPTDMLFERLIESKSKRPLIKDLTDKDLRAYIAKMLEERSVFYEKANNTVNAAHITNAVEEISQLICQLR